jgi:NADH-quinone oxidoreductase subunit L
MNGIVTNLWLIPALPLLAAGLIAVTKRPYRRWAAGLAIGSMGLAFALSLSAFITTLTTAPQGGVWRQVYNFTWFELGTGSLRLGWVLDPLTAVMLVMVTLVSALIFIYSVGYMAADENYTRFFGFLALFAAAMLGLVIANNLLLLFMCWELVGLASYLLIGFWYHKPSAAAAAKKAFITTRIGDIGFLLGMVWLYGETGTLLFYDNGQGCLEASALAKLVATTTVEGMAVSTAISLLLFCGAMGKSGQVPLHVWLPDAMEGPTPVSALIHAATMVAAGVFLMARIFPLLDTDPLQVVGYSTALAVVAWVGAITAVFAACIAVAQTDIKRILAYSTVSQLGYMMLAIGVGGYVAGMFHLITHAFFKALLFLGAGSVIHGCHEEQDIRRMGGLKPYMPITFLTYAIGMMALAGVPVFFSGFWSKDEILHAALSWPISKGPFVLGLAGAFLTAFYMTRQVASVFYGPYRGAKPAGEEHKKEKAHHSAGYAKPHESPAVMVIPLQILAGAAILIGFVGTPAWPWFHAYFTGEAAEFELGRLFRGDTFGLMVLSTIVVFSGIGFGWSLYGKNPRRKAEAADPLEVMQPGVFAVLRQQFRVDAIYEATVIELVRAGGRWFQWVEDNLWSGAVSVAEYATLGLAWLNRMIDEYAVNQGFDASCEQFSRSGKRFSLLQDGQLQHYLRAVGVAVAALMIWLAWEWML